MKQIKCEMCGSTELVKENGIYVCQSCGTKYSVDEARKLMVEVEGKVDVSGSAVKIDNVNELANAINAPESKEAKTKTIVGLVLSAISEILSLFFGPICYLRASDYVRISDYNGSMASEGMAYAAIAIFAVLFILNVVFIIKPCKINFLFFALFVVLYYVLLICCILVWGWLIYLILFTLIWIALIKKNYSKIK